MQLNFEKGNGLLPVIIQDHNSLKVLMLGYMNREAYEQTVTEGKVTFYSRSKERLWTKGETSGNFLWVKDTHLDCDQDALIIQVQAEGPTCHQGTTSCFNLSTAKGFLYTLEQTIHQRIDSNSEQSYTNQLYRKGMNKIAQKVGEEAIELVIEAKDDHIDLFKNEAADLLFHLLILLKAKQLRLEDIEAVLQSRHLQLTG